MKNQYDREGKQRSIDRDLVLSFDRNTLSIDKITDIGCAKILIFLHSDLFKAIGSVK
jgi:hypothetical protein